MLRRNVTVMVIGDKKISFTGEVSERLKEHAWKVCKGQPFEGSNPSLSANKRKGPRFLTWALFLYQWAGGFDENPSVRPNRQEADSERCVSDGPAGARRRDALSNPSLSAKKQSPVNTGLFLCL